MPAISEVLIDSQTHPYLNADPVTVTGDPVKGDGYYGWGDGLHTVSFEVTGFVGTIWIDATTNDTIRATWLCSSIQLRG